MLCVVKSFIYHSGHVGLVAFCVVHSTLRVHCRHAKQNKEQRSCSASASWDLRQLKGEWLVHIREIGGKLYSRDGLSFCGLSSALTNTECASFAGDLANQLAYVADMTKLYCLMAIELMGLRIR